MSMLDNQAFGWLKKSIIGGGEPDEEIAGCSDPSILVNGVALDFNVLLMMNGKNAVGSSNNVAASGDGTNANGAIVGGDSSVTKSDATEEEDGAPTSSSSNTANGHLNDLTSRLDRIKTLLYEERSASSQSVTQSGTLNLNWTPSIATSVYKSFTSASTSTTTNETNNINNIDEATTTKVDITSNNSITYNPKQFQSSSSELLPNLIQNLPLLPFEARKSISAIFNYLLVCGLDGIDAQQFTSVSTAFANYVLERGECIIGQLVNGHDCSSKQQSSSNATSTASTGVVDAAGGNVGGSSQCVDITLLCGSMLRSSLRHASIYQWTLSNENCEQLVYPFLDYYVHNPNFDVSSDALETVRVMFTGCAGGTTVSTSATSSSAGGINGGGMSDASSEEYKQLMESIASDFLNRKYVEVIDERINKKCLSSNANYMTRRMSLQLLSTILLNRANYNVMMMYISSSQNLVTILCLLRDPSPHITLDAFQVFKIFVANPNKVSLETVICITSIVIAC